MRVTAVKAAEACEVLDIDLEGLTEAAVTAAYRNKAKSAHPDMGGSLEAMAAISNAKQLLEWWLEAVAKARQEPNGRGKGNCRACAGQGYIQRRTGFQLGPRMHCVLCEGSGNVKRHDREE